VCRKLYGRAGPLQPSDLTAKARIREAALELFSQDGAAATSMRSVAAKAGVSPSLVVHHFRTKAQLREAVDDAVVAAFGDALGSIDLSGTAEEVAAQLEAGVSGLIGGNRAVRDYLVRSVLEAGPASERLFDALMDLVDSGLATLDASGHLVHGLDVTWRSYTAVFVILGPALLHRQIAARLGADAFAPEVVRARSACNMAILHHGLFRS